MDNSILNVNGVEMFFPIRKGVFRRVGSHVRAVDGVSFSVSKGETLGIVGESGCGKTTLGRAIMGLYSPTAGNVLFNGVDMMTLKGKSLKNMRKNIQMIFQDPYESLNPRHSIGHILEEPFLLHGYSDRKERLQKVEQLIEKVGLPWGALDKFPHEFSGGQRQRIGVARALALNPALVICDEPVSALDVSIQSQILNLLMDLQEELSLTYVFISHDLTVVRHISDRILVMYLGRIVEEASGEDIYENPAHPYTKALISAIPIPDPFYESNRIVLQGTVPSPISPPQGCHFHPRCPYAEDICRREYPPLEEVQDSSGHRAACHFKGEQLK